MKNAVAKLKPTPVSDNILLMYYMTNMAQTDRGSKQRQS